MNQELEHRDEPAAERCRDLYDEEHLEQVFASVQHAAESAWITCLEGPDVRVWRSEFERPFLWYRACAEAEGVPVEAITRFISTSPHKKINNFLKREDVHVELRPADPTDEDGLGRIVVLDQSSVFFGFHVLEKRLYATRRLPDGTGLGIRLPVDFDPVDGRWTTRRFEEKFVPLVAYHSESTSRGSRLMGFYKERPTIGFFPFLPTSIVNQLLLRFCANMMLQFRRTFVSKWQAADAWAPRPARRLLFASGSAAPPLHLSSPTFSRHVVHAWAPRVQLLSPDSSPELDTGSAYPPPEPRPPSNPDANDLFLGLIGVEKPPAASNEPRDPGGRTFLLSDSQLVKAEGFVETPGYRSLVSEAVRASLDLSIRMEALSLGVPPPAQLAGAPPAPAAAGAGKPRARPRAEEGAEAAGPAPPVAKEEAAEGPPQPPAKPKRDPSHRKPRPPPQPYRPPRPILAKPAPPGPPLPPPAVEPSQPTVEGSPPTSPPAYPLQPTAAGLPAGYYVTYRGTPPLSPLVVLAPSTFPATAFELVPSPPGTL